MLDHVEKVEAISTSAQKQHGLKAGWLRTEPSAKE